MTLFLIFILVLATAGVAHFGDKPSDESGSFVGFFGSLIALVWAAFLLWISK